MEHELFFKDFLKDEVNLNKTRIDTLEERKESITNYLNTNLSGYKKFSEQGSYAHKTIIKPVDTNDSFDVDILVYIKNDDFTPKDFKEDYVDTIYQVFKGNDNYVDKITKNTRCVTIKYAGDFHLDIVPCVEKDSTYYICNRNNKEYEKTDGDGYKQWLIGKNEITGNNNLRKVTRILKFLRDYKNTFSVKSILLTTILGNQVGNAENFSNFPTALKEISNRLNDFLQQNENMPIIANPVLPEEDFNRHWDQIKYKNFREKFNSYNEKINKAFKETKNNESVKKWREIFGDTFGRLIEGPKEPNKLYNKTIVATKPYSEKL